MPSPWPPITIRGPQTRAELFLDTPCFSTSDFDNFDDLDTDDNSPLVESDLTKLISMPFRTPELLAEMNRRRWLSNYALDVQARYNHPTFPPATFLTTLCQQQYFSEYILNEFPSLSGHDLQLSTANHEPLRKEVNATVANTLLNSTIPTTIGTTDWIQKAVFPDDLLPVPFKDEYLDNIQECWDKSAQRFSHFPQNMVEHAVQDWLNHLAHTLGLAHGLIQKSQEEPDEEPGEEPEEEPGEEPDGPGEEPNEEPGEEFVGTFADEDIGADKGLADGRGAGMGGAGEEVVYHHGLEKAFVVTAAEDRSFSMVAHKIAPSGGYRLRKPDIVLVNRSLRHFLKGGGLRPRWHHVEAILEVSSSASRDSMLQQILEKASLMFEAQPFRRFALALAFRGTGEKIEFCFLMIDRAGVCLTSWTNIAGYEGIALARIIFALSYAHPALLGVDTSMTIDPFSGNVTKIHVKGQEFTVIKHIYSSLVLFGRGTHVFLVQDKDGKSHVLKDAWLLGSHGISEIETLSSISNTLMNDTSETAQKYRSMHPRFIVGEEMGDSTTERRGRLVGPPPERVHRRVVTGPIGDPLTSFRSRQEFVEVLLNCVDWLQYLHEKCKIVHGDLSINNIVIYRTPPSRPPPIPLRKMGAKRPSLKNTQHDLTANAAVKAAPEEGLKVNIPVTGVVIDYDYARKVGTVMEKTSGTLPFMPIAALDKENRGNYVHGPGEDLESLLHTILGVVTFTVGPCGQTRATNDHVPLARWYNEIDREQLRKDKAIDLISYDREIQSHLPEYWKPFAPHLRRLVEATYPKFSPFPSSAASHIAFKKILETALTDLRKNHPETLCSYARVIGKRTRGSNDKSRYPYKNFRGDVSSQRLPQPATIMRLSEWTNSESVDK